VGFGEFVRHIRADRLKWKRGQFAEALDVAPETVTRWEKETIEPPVETLERICQLLHFHFEDCLHLPDEWKRTGRDELRDVVMQIMSEERANSPPVKSSK
jgi:DNA-binding XRE family transcriptional regulator